VHSTSTSAHSASDTLRRGESKVFAAIHNRQPAHAEHTHTHSHACPERDSAVTFLFHLQMIVGRLSVFYSSMSCRRTLLGGRLSQPSPDSHTTCHFGPRSSAGREFLVRSSLSFDHRCMHGLATQRASSTQFCITSMCDTQFELCPSPFSVNIL
jgi:hypothetical protein